MTNVARQDSEGDRGLPLSGIRVLELGTYIAGPFAGQQLGDLGAEVIKVEHPETGDPMRHWRDFGKGDLWWPSIARNKKSLTLNLSRPEAQDIVLRLVGNCHALIENFRPGTLERWGIGPDRLHAVNPSLVITRISGFGQTGPKARQPGFGSVGEAMGGLRHLTGWPDRPSTRAGISLGDEIASLFAVIGTLAALRHAEQTGVGQVVDVAIYEAVFAMMESLIAEYELAGHIRGRTGPTLPGIVPSNVYNTRDGDEVLIAANSDTIFARLVDALELNELRDDPDLERHTSRAAHAERVDKAIADRVARYTTTQILDVLERSGIPHSLIYTAKDIVTDPQYQARRTVQRLNVPGIGLVAMPAPTPRLSRTPGRIRHTGPRLGEHTDQILKELVGLEESEIGDLRAAGVV